jgi:phosphatidylserine decarboxylase
MIHKEGRSIILMGFFTLAKLWIFLPFTPLPDYLQSFIWATSLAASGMVLYFFRNPARTIVPNPRQILAPADGKIIQIRKVVEKEFFQDERLQISIFMSPLNVHVTRYPVGGKVVYSEHHPGHHYLAWLPKSSEKNERTTVVIDNPAFGKVLYRQIAGTVARRIVNYAQKGEEVAQGADGGFIKFGSRLDLFLPLNTKLSVNLGDTVFGGESVIVCLPNLITVEE